MTAHEDMLVLLERMGVMERVVEQQTRADQAATLQGLQAQQQ